MLIIPNLDLPKGCAECPCENESHCGALFYLTGYCHSIPYEYLHTGADKERWPLCPLIEKQPGLRILQNKEIKGDSSQIIEHLTGKPIE